jgi:hypothetical protein
MWVEYLVSGHGVLISVSFKRSLLLLIEVLSTVIVKVYCILECDVCGLFTIS